MEMFRRTLVEVSSDNIPEILLDSGNFEDKIFANQFDRELLILWRKSGKEPKKIQKLVSTFPNAARIRILKRLNSIEFQKEKKNSLRSK